MSLSEGGSAIGDTIRPFSTVESIQGAMEAALRAIPPGKTFATVAFLEHDGAGASIKAGAAVRIGDSWSFAGEFKKPFGKPLEGRAMVVWSR